MRGYIASGGFVSVSAGTTASQVLNNFGATTQDGEPIPCGVLGGASKWLGLLPTNDGILLVDTIGSAIDTVLAVYTGSDLLHLTYVACDINSAPDGVRSLVRFRATAGTRYYVALDGVNGAQGTINLNWGLGTVPVVISAQTTPRVRQGAALSLSVAISNTVPAPSYQWRLNGKTILGATNAILYMGAFQLSQAGAYSVIVSNFAGDVTNAIATVSVALPIELGYEWNGSNGVIHFLLKGPNGQGFALQAAADLLNWTNIYLNNSVVGSGGSWEFLDVSSTNYPARFYRVVPWP